MVPPTIRSNLAGLRRRERLLTLVFGGACWLSIALVMLLLCGLLDWLIERDRDTPMSVRIAFVVLQAIAWTSAAFWFVLWPQIRWLPDDMLALWVEANVARFDHRLISAVQLNQPGARLDGMSKELVAVVTREAEQEARDLAFAQVADHRRLAWSAGLIFPVVLLFALPFALNWDVSSALLARQTLADVEIPRTVYLENISPDYWPVGDEIPVRFRVTGEFNDEMVGTLYMTPGGRFDLVYLRQDGDDAIFGVDLDPNRLPVAANLRFTARLADGRTRAPSEMNLVPRPVITDNQAWIILPAYVGKTPDGERYERQQGRGDVVGIPGSSVRVQFELLRPIKQAWVELWGHEFVAPKKSEEDVALAEVPKQKLEMTLRTGTKVDGRTKETIDVYYAETTFDLTPGLTSYRMIVEDEHGFDNVPKPRRSLRLVPEDPPQVVLLKDTFGLGEGSTFDLEGLPVVLGRQIRIPYRADGAFGLGRARVLYRVLKKHESGNEPQEDEEWTKLELPVYKPGPNLGLFIPQLGIFEGMSFNQQVSFYAMPSPDPDKILGRTTGGGRYFLETKANALIDSKGQTIKLKSGDQIEFCVEVFAMFREPSASIPSARSESRVSTVMEEKEFTAWMRLVGQEDERVRQLELHQKGVFERK